MAAKQDQPVILYFGNDWFADNRTSSHHIARWLAKRFRVYYIDCPGLRAPKGSGRDLKRMATKLWRALRGARPVSEGLKVMVLLQVPLHRFRMMRRLNRIFMTWNVRWLLWREGIQAPISWFTIPHPSSVAKRLGERLTVYYCTDDYSAMPGVNQQAVRAMDEELTRKADVVFATAETLVEMKRPLNDSTYFSPHGVDTDLFRRAQDPDLPLPADTADLPRPVVGFFGLIERWIDLELIDYLAEQRPGWTFLMIGRTAVPAEELPRRPNIHFIGQRPYTDMPAYGKQFDVAIIPFRLTDVILHANPLKLREYLAMGKPVVAVSTPEIDKFADIIETAHSREEFLAKLDAVLAQPESPAAVQRRLERVASASWNSRLEQVLRIVTEHLAGASGRAESIPVDEPQPSGSR
jgi:glycosyltransferase involved in cell wall biosynthesis